MTRLVLLILGFGGLAACNDQVIAPESVLPIYSVVDTLPVSARFARPSRPFPWDPGPPSAPAVRLESQTLEISGVFYLLYSGDDQYDRMRLTAVRRRHYQGAEPLDSVGAIEVSVDGDLGGAWASVSATQYTTHLYGLLPGRYRLTVTLSGLVMGPGVLLDSIVVVP